MSFKEILAKANIGDGDNLDEEFLTSYRKLLIGQYQTLQDPAEAKKEAERIMAIPEDEAEWVDLYRLELATIALEPEELLRRRAWVLRNEYKEIASSEEYKDYLESEPPKQNTENVGALRADLLRLQEELSWRYLVMWVLEAVRSSIVKRLLYFNLPIVLIFLVVAQIAKVSDWVASWIPINLPLLAYIVAPGIVGGLVSTLRRIQSTSFTRNADLDLTELFKSNVGIFLSPVFGGIFAVLLYFLFAGDLVTGGLFPKVSVDMLFTYPPPEDGGGELAKIVAWSFIAGFAEKFVPDNLERLTKEDSSKGNDPKKPTSK